MKKITAKQRATLRSMANKLNPSIIIGKGGITDNLISQVDVELEARELVKGSILKTALLDSKTVCNELAEKLGAQAVQAIGSKFVLYRESKENKQIIL
ncbi:MAG: ribosome assembly RNA-binding protein YhbY [Eubacteriales bacterium]